MSTLFLIKVQRSYGDEIALSVLISTEKPDDDTDNV